MEPPARLGDRLALHTRLGSRCCCRRRSTPYSWDYRWLTVVAQNILATVILVVPVTLMLAGFESSAREASIGKRVRHLLVVNSRTGQRVSFRRALARNTMKLAVPWTVGHAAVYSIVAASAAGSIPPSILVITAFAYVLPLVYIASLFFGTGRTPYDRISGTTATLVVR